MTQLHFLIDLNKILLIAVFWASILFIVGTSIVWKWWTTDFGWTIILKTAAIAIILLDYNLHVMFGIKIGGIRWNYVGAIGLSLVILALIWRFIVIVVIQRYSPPPTKSGKQVFGQVRRRLKEKKKYDLDSSS